MAFKAYCFAGMRWHAHTLWARSLFFLCDSVGGECPESFPPFFRAKRGQYYFRVSHPGLILEASVEMALTRSILTFYVCQRPICIGPPTSPFYPHASWTHILHISNYCIFSFYVHRHLLSDAVTNLLTVIRLYPRQHLLSASCQHYSFLVTPPS